MYFVKGLPVNEKEYSIFKRIIMEELKFNDVEISEGLIIDVFNPIKDEITGITISSSNKQFELFCNSHNLEYKQHFDKPSYLIRMA